MRSINQVCYLIDRLLDFGLDVELLRFQVYTSLFETYTPTTDGTTCNIAVALLKMCRVNQKQSHK